MPLDHRELPEVLLASLPDAALVVGPNGRIEMAGPRVEGLFGYQPSELVGEQIETLIPEHLRNAHTGHRTTYIASPSARTMGSGLELQGRRKDGSTVPVDVSLSPVIINDQTFVAAFVRDATERRRREDLLRFVNEIARVLLAAQGGSSTLNLTSSRALHLAEADASWVVLPRGGALVVAAAEGERCQDLIGAELSLESSISARAIAQGASILIEDMSSDPDVLPEARVLELGSGMYVPMISEEGAYGILVVARRRGSRPFSRADAQILGVYASAASIMLTLGEARRELDQLRLVAEHERIARDLHDNVIQRLFAIGLSLQGVQPLSDGVVEDRIGGSVEAIDEVIREIRETIFELNRPGNTGMRSELKRLVADVSGKFGIKPALQFQGPVDSIVGDELASHLLSVTREALSNAARHGGATSVEVTLSASAEAVSLRVRDDGKGFPDHLEQGRGLSNMDDRARLLGGTFRIVSSDESGSLIEWEVPTPA
ncbi:MAG TPA: PAS domain S-box protein [Acidimicrobiales bacterium]